MGIGSRRQWIGLAACLAATACGGGGSGGVVPALYDLTGHWQLFLAAGGSAETGPLPVYLAQDGVTIDGVALTGTLLGTSLAITADAGSFTIALAGTATSADSALGTATLSGSINGTGTFRLERYAPAGTVTVDGTLDGIPVSASSAAGAGGRNYADAALTTLTSVLVALVDENVDVQLELAAGGLAVGALAVPGDVAVEVLYRDDDAVVSATATGGTVTVTRYDGTGIAGTYSLTTAAGTITGSFDVAFDLEAYDP